MTHASCHMPQVPSHMPHNSFLDNLVLNATMRRKPTDDIATVVVTVTVIVTVAVTVNIAVNVKQLYWGVD